MILLHFLVCFLSPPLSLWFKFSSSILIMIGRLSRFADEIAREEKAQVFAIRIDCSDAKSVREAFEGVHSLGFVEVLVYNACQPMSSTAPKFTDIRLDSFEKSLAVSTVGAFHCSQQVVKSHQSHHPPTIIDSWKIFIWRRRRIFIHIYIRCIFQWNPCLFLSCNFEGASGDGRERKRNNLVHWLFSFAKWHCWLLWIE